jgi:hypothetical protein
MLLDFSILLLFLISHSRFIHALSGKTRELRRLLKKMRILTLKEKKIQYWRRRLHSGWRCTGKY